jgi:predicted kinase
MNNFIMLCGIPASGKSFIANQIINMDCSVIHSSDELRLKMFGDINDNEHNNELFEALHNNIIVDLKHGKNVIYDACSISYKRRMEFLKRINSINCYKICYWFATPYEICIERNKNRDRIVPEEAIKRMYLNFYVPQYFEGWDDINIIYNTKDMEFSTQHLFEKLNNVEQETPYHTKTIGQHCLACESLMTEKDTTGDIILLQAAKLHDIGKELTKTYNSEK